MVFPIGSIILGIAVKYVTRNDQYAKFSKEDMAVGLDLVRTALMTYLVIISDRALTIGSANRMLARALADNISPAEIARLQGNYRHFRPKLPWADGSYFCFLFSCGAHRPLCENGVGYPVRNCDRSLELLYPWQWVF